MVISKHSFASTRHRSTSRKIENHPGDEIPTRSVAFGQSFVHFRTFCEPNLSTIVFKRGSNTQIGTIADKHKLR